MKENLKADSSFYLEGRLIEAASNHITWQKKRVRVEPQVMKVLLHLVASVKNPVSREILIDQIGSNHLGSDDALNRTIWKLRKALGDNDAKHPLIETLPRQGYILNGTISTSRENSTRNKIQWFATAAGALVILLVSLIYFGTEFAKDPAATLVENQSKKVMNARQLTDFSGYEMMPEFSPDGKKLIFSNWAYVGENAKNNNLFELNLADLSWVKVTNGPGEEINPQYSPDGRALLYVDLKEEGCSIIYREFVTGEEKQIAECDNSYPSNIVWSPDGDFIYFTGPPDENGPYRVMRMNADGTDLALLTNPPSDFMGDLDLALSPDGNSMVYVRERLPGHADLYLLDLISGMEKRLTFEEQGVSGVIWTSDENKILFSSDRNGPFALWELSTSGEINPVPTVGMNASEPAYFSDKQILVYSEWKSEINIWRVQFPAGSGGTGPLISSAKWDWAPQISPKGDKTAFLSNRNGFAELWVSDLDKSVNTKVTKFEKNFSSTLSWSYNSRYIALAVPDEIDFDLFIYDTQTKNLRKVTKDVFDERNPVFSEDDLELIFSSNRSGNWELWAINLESSATKQLTTNGGYIPGKILPGHPIYFVKKDVPGIWSWDQKTGLEKLVIQDLSSMNQLNWFVGNTGIYYVSGSYEDGFNLNYFSFSEETSLLITSLPEQMYFQSGIFISEEEGFLLIPHIDKSNSDLWALTYSAQ